MITDIKKHPQVFLLLLGLAGAMIAVSTDFLGVGEREGLGARQFLLLAIGLSFAAIGLLWDLLSKRRLIVEWGRRHLASWQELLQAAAVTGQIFILMLAARQLNLENEAFYQIILVLCLYGFMIHYLLPDRLKLPFFVLLSLLGYLAVLGVQNTAILFLLGLGMIGLTHLPLPHGWRVVIVLLTGSGLGLMRAGVVDSPVPAPIWPIFGAIFMFRLIIYIYDLKKPKNAPTFFQTLSYFFLLPNVIFPLFPVIDFKVFRKTYYNTKPFQIYQRGVEWMLRGILHLLLYRLVNYNFVIGPDQIETIADFGQMMVANFSLYLRVSGQFHIVAGILHLFGFNLPVTHHLYFLSKNFLELWRRMNIYWKDFIQKVFFYPAYFKLRRFGDRTGILLATIISFIATWFLHAYQWFWLRGQFLFSIPDALFWLILGSLVVWVVLKEQSPAVKPSRKKRQPGFKDLAAAALRASAVFFFMAAIWSLWTSASLSEWFGLLRLARVTPGSLLILTAGILAIMIAIGVGVWLENKQSRGKRSRSKDFSPSQFYRQVSQTAIMGALLLAASHPLVLDKTTGKVNAFLNDIRTAHLSQRDQSILERGYYEDLIGVDRFNPDLWNLYTKKPVDWVDLVESDAVRLNPGSLVHFELLPSHQTTFHGTPFVTNRWGMRDQEYEQPKPDGVFRIALLGSSRTMGSGVVQEQTFEALVETQLNEQFGGQAVDRYEILNFSVGGYTLLHNLIRLKSAVLSFQPDMVIIVPHPEFERTRSLRHLANSVRQGVPLPYPFLDDLAARAGIDAHTPEVAALDRLMPFGDELLMWAFDEFARQVTEQGAAPVLLSFPNLNTSEIAENLDSQLSAASAAGIVVIRLDDPFAGYDPAELVVAGWDYHPNTTGHQLIARVLFEALVDQRLIPLP